MNNLILNETELELLFKQDPRTKGDGGYQSLLVDLQMLTDRVTGEIEVTNVLFDKIRNYAFNYKNGGWQNRLVGIFGRHWGPNLDMGFFDESPEE